MGWLRFIKLYFHGFGACLVVRTLRGKSLTLHAFPFMDLSRRLDKTAHCFPSSLVHSIAPTIQPSIHPLALLNNVSIYSVIWVTHLKFVDTFIFCTSQIHTVLLQKKKKSDKRGIVMGWLCLTVKQQTRMNHHCCHHCCHQNPGKLVCRGPCQNQNCDHQSCCYCCHLGCQWEQWEQSLLSCYHC